MKLALEKFTFDDFPLYYSLVSKETVMKGISYGALGQEEAEIRFGKLLYNSNLHKNFGFYKFLDLENNDFLGFGKLEIEQLGDEQAELGYIIVPEHWRKGLGTKLSKLLVEKAIEDGLVHTLYAIIDPNNEASRKILKKCGFVFKGYQNLDGVQVEVLERKLFNQVR